MTISAKLSARLVCRKAGLRLRMDFGADDLDGTIIEEKITHSAGAMTGEGMTRDELIHLIKKAGKEPVERDGFYNMVKRDESASGGWVMANYR